MMKHWITSTHLIDYLVIFLITHSSTLSVSFGQFTETSTIEITSTTFESFHVSWPDSVGSPTYSLSVEPVHGPQEERKIFTTVGVDEGYTVTGLRSNINYLVTVQEFSNPLSPTEVSTEARTAPNGTSILQTIATPTFITVFLEEVPGSTAWQIKYTNVEAAEIFKLDVPSGTPSYTNYVAIIKDLSPNTRYNIQARVSQINSATNFNESQSPYGVATEVTTERLSAFGRVQLLTRHYNLTANNDETLKAEIAEELRGAYNADDVFNVSIIELEEYESSGRILCHHEILLNNKTAPSSTPPLTLIDSTLYDNLEVRYRVSESKPLKGYQFSDNKLKHVEGPHCATDNLEKDIRTWTLFSKNGEDPSSTLTETAYLEDETEFLFTDTAIQYSTGEEIFRLAANTIYGIKQSYLLKTCISRFGDITIYDRLYGAFSFTTRVESDKYTIFHTTKPSSSYAASLLARTSDNETSVILEIPQTLLSRATAYTLNISGTIVNIPESSLDSSTNYMVQVRTDDVNILVGISAETRTHQGLSTITKDFFDIDEGTKNETRHGCDENATCKNNLLSCICTCNTGFRGDGFKCEDIHECESGLCPIISTCQNTIGSFICTCDAGFSGNGFECEDFNECESISPCHIDATCENSFGSFSCTCNTGFNGDGFECEDVNECESSPCHIDATCQNTIGSFTCNCKDGHSGNGFSCEETGTDDSTSEPVSWIAAPTIAGLTLLVVLAVAVQRCKKT